MLQSTLPGFVVALLATLYASSASAATVVDQSYNPGAPTALFVPSTGVGNRFAQTFTVGVAGTLSDIEVYGSQLTGLNILSVGPFVGVPSSNILWTTTSMTIVGSEDTIFHLSDFGIAVFVGQVLAFEPIGASIGRLNANNPGSYLGGGGFRLNAAGGPPLFSSTGGDIFFTTYISPSSVPEPSPLVLALLAICAQTIRHLNGRRTAPGICRQRLQEQGS